MQFRQLFCGEKNYIHVEHNILMAEKYKETVLFSNESTSPQTK
jgi:hypothetical protein